MLGSNLQPCHRRTKFVLEIFARAGIFLFRKILKTRGLGWAGDVKLLGLGLVLLDQFMNEEMLTEERAG